MTTPQLIVIVSVRGGIVQEVRANAAVRIFVEDWDAPDHRPTWDELPASPLTTDDHHVLRQIVINTY